jgi:hypothetical protein
MPKSSAFRCVIKHCKECGILLQLKEVHKTATELFGGLNRKEYQGERFACS